MGHREGSLVKSRRGPRTFLGDSGPKISAFRASRPALARPERERQRERRQGAEAAARAAPWGRLEDVQKVLTRRAWRGLAGLPGRVWRAVSDSD